MIVKNESLIIGRMLSSLLGKIDMMSIVDTGSTDDTKSLIEAFGAKHKIPTIVHQSLFVDFGANRTECVVKAQHSFPTSTYILLSDADFIWEGNMPSRHLLFEPAYQIEQYSATMRYWNIRLLRAEIDWECKLKTHEFWRACKSQSKFQGEITTSARVHDLIIRDKEDGGCKADKLERDVRLLKQGLVEDKEDFLLARGHFYLGQTLHGLKRYLESTTHYEMHLKHEVWDQERYYSMYQIGKNYEELGWEIIHRKRDQWDESLAVTKTTSQLKQGTKDTELQPQTEPDTLIAHENTTTMDTVSVERKPQSAQRNEELDTNATANSTEGKHEEEDDDEEEKEEKEKGEKGEKEQHHDDEDEDDDSENDSDVYSDEDAQGHEKARPDDFYHDPEVKVMFDLAKTYYYRAYQFRKTRAEALHKLAKLHRVISEHKDAFDYAVRGRKIKLSDDTLFVEPDCYGHAFDFEISIVANYVGQRKAGRKALESLLNQENGSVPEFMIKQCKRNAQFYV
jgi:glycosyltransferase involved in cell wall biosynthesis